MGGFPGFPAEAIDFFEGLRADNCKSYWQEHKATYDTCVRAPMEALLEDLAEEFGPAKLYRPYRDVRFSKDKSPYQTHLAAGLGEGPAGWYVCLKYDCLIVGFGVYEPGTEARGRIRDAIVDDRRGGALDKIVTRLEKDGFVLSGAMLKTAPRGYPADHPRVRLLRCQSMVLAKSWPPAPWFGEPAAARVVAEACRAGKPLVNWLEEVAGR